MGVPMRQVSRVLNLLFAVWFTVLNVDIQAFHTCGLAPCETANTSVRLSDTELGLRAENAFCLCRFQAGSSSAGHRQTGPALSKAVLKHSEGPCLACLYLSSPQMGGATIQSTVDLLPVVSNPMVPEGSMVASDCLQLLLGRAPPCLS